MIRIARSRTSREEEIVATRLLFISPWVAVEWVTRTIIGASRRIVIITRVSVK